MSEKQEISNTENDKISKGSAELNELIKKINLLPKDWEKFLKESRVFIDRLNLELHSEMQKQEIGFLPCSKFSELCPDDVLIFSERFRRLAPKLIERMGLNLETDGLENAQFQVKVLYEQNLALRNIIHIFQQFKEFNNPKQTFMLNKPLQTIGFNADSTLNLVGFRVMEILKRENIPIERVRVCPICRDVFWAKRSESPACSTSHVNTFNRRLGRIRESVKELRKHLQNLEKLQTNLSPENRLISEQKQKNIKLAESIKRRKEKWHFTNAQILNTGG